MAFEVKKVDYATAGECKQPTCIEVQTEIGKMKVEDSIFKNLIKEGDKAVGVELTSGIKVRDLNGIYNPNGKITIFDMPLLSSDSTKTTVPKDENVEIFVEDTTVHVDSANRKFNSIDIYNRNGTVSVAKDKNDSVDCITDNERFIMQQRFFD